MKEELRWRGKCEAKEVKSGGTTHVSTPRPRPKFKLEWDLLFWMLGSFALLYFTDFASHLLFNPIVKRWWLLVAMLLLGTSIVSLVYSMRCHPLLNSTNWTEQAPVLVPVATLCSVIGGLSFCIAVWPVWTFYTLLIMPTLFMGFISTVSLFNI